MMERCVDFMLRKFGYRGLVHATMLMVTILICVTLGVSFALTGTVMGAVLTIVVAIFYALVYIPLYLGLLGCADSPDDSGASC